MTAPRTRSEADGRTAAFRRPAAPGRAPGLPPFETIVELHGPAVLRFCIARGGAQTGEDAFQETMISALRAYSELRDVGAARGWLFSIAHRKTIDAHRAAARTPQPVGGSDAAELAGAQAGAGAADRLGRRGAPAPAGWSAADPQADVTAGSEADDLWSVVRTLPGKQREAVTLRYLADLTNGEIAELMGTTPEAARRNVFEGLRRLRSLVEPG